MNSENPCKLSSQTSTVLTNWILHSPRFGMMKELHNENPFVGLVKSIFDLVASNFGRVPQWERCQNQLRSSVTAEQFRAICEELCALSSEWIYFSILSFGAPTQSFEPDEFLAKKIRTIKSRIEGRIELIKDLRTDPEAPLTDDAKHPSQLTTLTIPVLMAYVDALNRLEAMRLQRPGAMLWPE